MLVDAVVEVLLAVFTGFLSLLPSYSLPNLGGLGSSIGASVAGANSVFPVTTLGACIAAVVGLRIFLTAVAVVAWIWDKVPFTFK